ncbi:hypothetical protein YK56LOC_49580 [Caballeronia sp. HLA56]
MLDLNLLRLKQLEVESIESADGEFYVRLRINKSRFHEDRNATYKKRIELVLRISDEAAITAPAMQESLTQVEGLTAQLEESRTECVRLHGECEAVHQTLDATRRSMVAS